MDGKTETMKLIVAFFEILLTIQAISF